MEAGALSSLLGSLGEVFTFLISKISEVFTAIVSNPIALIPIGIIVAYTIVKFTRNLLGL